MRIVRIYAGADGHSHFVEREVSLAEAGAVGRVSARQPATGVVFRETGGDYDYDWHNAPARQYVIMLEGTVELEASDGEVRRLGPGDILLAEDTTGRGHRSRAVDGRPRRTVFVTLD